MLNREGNGLRFSDDPGLFDLDRAAIRGVTAYLEVDNHAGHEALVKGYNKSRLRDYTVGSAAEKRPFPNR
jgi:hypothetical protein